MSTPEQIQKALGSLDVGNDNHWTGDGLPRLETVKMLAGDQSVTRDAVTAAAPGFTRASAIAALQAPPPVAPVPVAETPPAAPTAAATPETPVAPAPEPPPVQPAAPVVPAAPVAAVQGTGQSGLPSPEVTLAPASNPNHLANIPAVDNSDAVSQKTEELLLVDAQIAELDQTLNLLGKQKRELTVRSDALRLDIEKLTPRDDNQLAIQAYLRSQNATLQARGRQQAALQKLEGELGIRLADLVPRRSPLDTAMSRKTGFGGQRPK